MSGPTVPDADAHNTAGFLGYLYIVHSELMTPESGNSSYDLLLTTTEFTAARRPKLKVHQMWYNCFRPKLNVRWKCQFIHIQRRNWSRNSVYLYLFQPFLRYYALSVLGSLVWPFRVTWHHRLHNQSILHRPFPININGPLEPSRPLSLTVPSKCQCNGWHKLKRPLDEGQGHSCTCSEKPSHAHMVSIGNGRFDLPGLSPNRACK